MVFEKDFPEFCSLLNEKKIDYLVVGLRCSFSRRGMGYRR